MLPKAVEVCICYCTMRLLHYSPPSWGGSGSLSGIAASRTASLSKCLSPISTQTVVCSALTLRIDCGILLHACRCISPLMLIHCLWVTKISRKTVRLNVKQQFTGVC